MDTDTLVNDGFIEEDIDEDEDVFALIERTIRSYWNGKSTFDPSDLAEILIDAIEENGYEIKETLAD